MEKGAIIISSLLDKEKTEKVLSQQMVSTPVTELDSDIVQKDGWNKPDFSI